MKQLKRDGLIPPGLFKSIMAWQRNIKEAERLREEQIRSKVKELMAFWGAPEYPVEELHPELADFSDILDLDMEDNEELEPIAILESFHASALI